MTVGRAWRILLAICGGAVLLGISILRLHTQLTGTPGLFTAASCVVSSGSDKDEPAYECVGSFDPTNGTFHIPYLEVDTTFPAPPREPVAVFVDEGDSDTAVVTGNEAWLPQGIAGLVLLPAGIFMAVRAARTAPRT